MNAVLTLLDTNRLPVQFLYGQAFFIAAPAIALRINARSDFRLARVIWLFALVAALHAFSEWGEVFIPLQGTYMPDVLIRSLQVFQVVLVGSSFVLL